jgi:hypothetical protein
MTSRAAVSASKVYTKEPAGLKDNSTSPTGPQVACKRSFVYHWRRDDKVRE